MKFQNSQAEDSTGIISMVEMNLKIDTKNNVTLLNKKNAEVYFKLIILLKALTVERKLLKANPSLSVSHE